MFFGRFEIGKCFRYLLKIGEVARAMLISTFCSWVPGIHASNPVGQNQIMIFLLLT